MTTIRMDWDTLILTAEGHAGGGEPGKDVVCAGISALTMALVNQLENEDDTGSGYRMDERKGMIMITARPKDPEVRRRVRDYFRVIMTGLQGWEKAFPRNIKTEEVNEDGTD